MSRLLGHLRQAWDQQETQPRTTDSRVLAGSRLPPLNPTYKPPPSVKAKAMKSSKVWPETPPPAAKTNAAVEHRASAFIRDKREEMARFYAAEDMKRIWESNNDIIFEILTEMHANNAELLDKICELEEEKELKSYQIFHVKTNLYVKQYEYEAEIEQLKEENEALAKKLNIISESSKHDFVCPIAHEVFMDPVVASDGHTYERASIEKWFKTKKTSPLTGQPIWDLKLTPNHTLKKVMQSHM